MKNKLQLRQVIKKNLPGRIRLTGSINNVLTSTIDEVNAERRNPVIVGYSRGLGAVGDSFIRVKDTFGELCTTPDFTGVLTAGEINHIISKPGKEVNFFSPFNVSIGHDFQYVYQFSTADKITFTELYDALFTQAENLPGYKGLLTVSMILVIIDFFGSLIKRAPLKGNLEKNSRIIEKDKFGEWFITGEEPDKNGLIAVSVGVGLDRKYAEHFPAESLDRIFYLHPANVGAVAKQLHNHCFILHQDGLPEIADDYNAAVSRLLRENEIIDVKHILDNTTISAGFAAVNVVENIEDCIN